MLPLIWSAEARADFLEIIDYIAARNPAAALRLHGAIN
jgi:plasmid stabilization system protein ParE